MPFTKRPSSADAVENMDTSRRIACAFLAMTPIVAMAKPIVSGKTSTNSGIKTELDRRYALMREAYRTTNAELMRQFYSDDVVFASEGAAPVVGLDAIIAEAQIVLPKRRDLGMDVLRASYSQKGDMAYHFSRLTAFPRDLSEKPRSATAFLVWELRNVGWRCCTEILLLQDMDLSPGFRTIQAVKPLS